MSDVRVRPATHERHIDEAARIWAEATAARDGDTEVAPLRLARPLIQAVLDGTPRSLLLVALDAGRVVGFAAVEPVPTDGSTAEIRYLGVEPAAWGRGVGRQLLRAAPAHLAAAGFARAELGVYVDNPRAVSLYEAAGWLPHGEAVPHPRSGRLEQRYRLDWDDSRQDAGEATPPPPTTDLRQSHDVAHAIAATALGRDPGPMTTADSLSHHVHVGADVVVKIIHAAGHSRLNREIALAPHLPAGITAPLLDSGLHELATGEVRYACYARVPGVTPGMGLPGVDEATARRLAEDAVQRLHRLHGWTPGADARRTLGETLDHGGFVGRDALLAEVEKLAALDRDGIVARRVLDGLAALAQDAPSLARADVPVHADCHWGNWLARDRRVTALLDFEWARLGEPMDDWFFLIRFSGPHREAVLDVVAGATETSPATLRQECEVREASCLTSDLRVALQRPATPARVVAENVRDLEELVVDRPWWR
ncbi:GNAT family N-acetyltransferase [Micromonospora sp. MSM11]|nr:GNAT family N-acetyltransferase [Micromonospora sp. MSM11]